MRKSIILLLILAMLASLLPAASAANLTELQQGLVQTALAYFYKGPYIQYDSTGMTAQARAASGVSRISSGSAPEDGGLDNTIYSVCSDFCYDIYYDATGYEILGTPRRSMTYYMSLTEDNDPMLVYRWRKDTDGDDADGKALDKAYSLLQPGDLIVGRTNQNSGHAMFYAGDVFGDGKNYIIHCSGGKVNLDTGEDKIETVSSSAHNNGGAIRADEAKSFLFTKGGKLCLSDKYAHFLILRPTKAADFGNRGLTEHAKARLKYPCLRVDKETSITKYQSPENGQTIKVTLTLHNYGTSDITGLPVHENAPVGATVTEGETDWTLNIPAGEAKKVSYTVTVTAKRGETVTIPHGKVDGLDTREITFRVSGKKPDAVALAKLAALKTASPTLKALNESNVAFVKKVYRDVLGIELPLPDAFNSLVSSLFKRCTPRDMNKSYTYMWQLKDDSELTAQYKTIKAMAIPEHLAGYSVYIGNDPDGVPHTMNPVDRTVDYKKAFYEPGDIFIGLYGLHTQSATDSDVETFVYLGNGNVLTNADGEVQVRSFETTIGRAYKYNVLLAFRPSLAYDDLTAPVAAKLPFTDVKEDDWFYSFVSELYADGTVNGMSATTFVPNGNLTYGQALKLIVCALGHGEQAKSGAHWASGYLTFAKEKGWLAGDVNLDDSISRLSFCRIAAKAKNLTATPASNPFTDTVDADVLALNHAGVINGMSDTTFAPDSTLTRAQISKIISLLRKL